MPWFWQAVLVAIFVVPVILLFGYAMLDVIRRPGMGFAPRALWLIAFCVLPIVGPLVYLSIVLVTTLATLAICSPHARTREVLATAAATMQVLALYGTFGWRESDQLGPHMAAMLPGTILIVGALVLGLRAAGRQQTHRSDQMGAGGGVAL